MFYLGIDVGKFTHSLCLIDESGHHDIWQIKNDKIGFESLLKKLSSLNLLAGSKLLAGMEATGHYFLNIYDFLLQIGLPVESIALLNPLQVKSFRNTNLRGAKSDNVDAERIAILLQFGNFDRCNVATDNIMNLRELTRLKADLTANLGNLKRKMIAVIDRIFPEFAKIFQNKFGSTVVALLTDYQTPEEFAELSLDELTALIKGLSKRGINRDKIQKLHEASRNSIGISFGRSGFKVELSILLIQLKSLEEQISFLENEIEKIISGINTTLFSIPGIGKTTGAAILAEIGDIDHFDSAIKLVAFAGLDPKLKESGTYQGRTPVSKRGSKYLRSALWYSAMVLCRVNDKFKEKYQERRKSGKSHRYAITAAANKLTKIVYHVLKNNCVYDPNLA
jgi:transposase